MFSFGEVGVQRRGRFGSSTLFFMLLGDATSAKIAVQIGRRIDDSLGTIGTRWLRLLAGVLKRDLRYSYETPFGRNFTRCFGR